MDLYCQRASKPQFKFFIYIDKAYNKWYNPSIAIAEKALEFGITHAETKGKLSKHLDGIFLLNYKPTNMRVYNHSVYLFNGNILITVLPLPHKFWAYADKLQKQKDSDKEAMQC